MFFNSILETIGNTPLVALDRLAEGLPARVLAKIESVNPGASVKDRAALRMIEEAEKQGLLKPGGTVVELTSGNMGAGLAIVCAIKGYRMVAVMSEGNSIERRKMLAGLGAEVALVPQAIGSVPGKVSGEDLALVEERTQALVKELNAFRPDQFNNPANAAAHELATGKEIWEQTDGKVTSFVAIAGSGGSFVGTARALKHYNPAIKCFVVEPETAQVIGGKPVTNSAHKLQGAGYALMPPLWDSGLCDGTIGITDEKATFTARALAKQEGIFGGFSSGANVAAALQLAKRALPGDLIVTLVCDSGLKYLSTDLVE
ncbi:MAG: cysteine synthase family protein [Chloroflexi bacterium]|uniref:cysteine synthase n=1 Tax=Candidatus Chlorohelix allophototropha TaxID=3003348 RepID=A0A8T7LUE0_9CHLR|nr:cysteine synthase family protein [Chloroflexota bacterium]WJW66360.1 cysteine synthase family protein [Chloroflexota bacterium L227-S17]